MAAVAILAAGSGPATAQEYLPDETTVTVPDPGWEGSLKVGANINFTHNRKFVGQPDGQQWMLGGSFDGIITLMEQGHDWRNLLAIQEAFSYGPPIDAFVKTADKFRFESIYYYHPEKLPWLGPFVRFNLETSIFEGSYFSAAPTDLVVTNESDAGELLAPDADATIVRRQYTGKTQHLLTDYFQPLTLRESVGVFARPVSTEPVELIFRLGFGSHQVFADDQYAVNDDEDTAPIEIIRMYSYVQAGLEGGLAIKGSFYENKVSYKAWGEFMIPWIRQKRFDSDDRSGTDLTNFDIGANLSFKLVEWASLDYKFKAVRQPQLIDEWQIQNMLMLTFGYSYTKKSEPPKAEAPAEGDAS